MYLNVFINAVAIDSGDPDLDVSDSVDGLVGAIAVRGMAVQGRVLLGAGGGAPRGLARGRRNWGEKPRLVLVIRTP